MKQTLLLIALGISTSAVALIGLAKLDEIILANHEMAHAITTHCYATAVGETAALMIVDSEIVCVKRFVGTSNGVWQRYLKRGKQL